MDERGINMHKHDVDPPAIQSPMKALSCSDKGGCSRTVFLECNPHFILVLLGFHPMQQPQPDRPRLWGWLLPLAQGNPTILGGTETHHHVQACRYHYGFVPADVHDILSPVSRNFSFPSLKVCTYVYNYVFELIELTTLRINCIEV